MRLPIKHHFCIWCGEALWNGQRSDEHVVPDCLGGRLKCPDICRGCNSGFGAESDWRLLNDHRIYQAATQAGVSHDEFLRTYEAVTTTSGGLQVRLRVTDGVSRVVGGLGASQVHIGSDAAGTFSSRDVASLRARKKSQAKAKCSHLEPQIIDREIDRMIDALFLGGPAIPAYSPLLGEGFALDSTSHVVQITRTYHPLDTFRAMAKSLYTVLKNVLPRTLERPMAESLVHLRAFAKGEIDTPNPVHFQRLRRKPARRHRLCIDFGTEGFCFEAVLYEALSWRIQGAGIAGNGQRARIPEFHWQAVDDVTIPDVVIRP